MTIMHKLLTGLGRLGCALICTACSPLLAHPSMDMEQWERHIRATPPPAILLLGEQHDAPEHQHWQHATVRILSQRQQLAAVVVEMADQGQSTQGLPTTATESQVQRSLQWNDKGWPWKAYGPTIMTAVRAGVPVLGGNLPRTQMKNVMQQTHWENHLPAPAWQQQREAIRAGHCDLLPKHQITPMARIQLAKDARMAQTATSVVQPGKTVVLIAGRAHVLRSIGIPLWLPANVPHTIAVAQAGHKTSIALHDRDVVVHTPAIPNTDHCAQLQKHWGHASKP